MGGPVRHAHRGRRAALRRAAPSLLACALAGLLAGPARGEGEGRRLSVTPSLRVTTVLDYNVFHEKDGELDVGVWLAPAVELSYRGRVVDAGAEVGGDFRQYALHHSELADYFFRIDAWAEAGLWPGLTARVSNRFAPTPVSLGLPETDGRNLVQTNRTQLDLRYWRELGRQEVELGLRGVRLMGDSFSASVPDGKGDLEDDDSFHPDYWELLAFGEVQRELSPRAQLFGRAQGRLRSFDDSPDSGFTDLSVLAGLRSEVGRDLEIEISGGYGLVSFDGFGTKSRFLGELRARYELPRGFVGKLTAGRRFSTDLRGPAFTETSGRLTLEKSFDSRTSAALAGFLGHYDAEAWSEEGGDLWGGVSLTLRRQLTRRMQASVVYRYWQNAGDRTVDDFAQNQIRLVLTYRR